MRKYLRKNFEEFVEKHGAEYIDEDGHAIFKAPENLYEDIDDELVVAGVLMTPTGQLEVGQVRLSCDNWESPTGTYTPEEAEWVGNLLVKLSKFK